MLAGLAGVYVTALGETSEWSTLTVSFLDRSYEACLPKASTDLPEIRTVQAIGFLVFEPHMHRFMCKRTGFRQSFDPFSNE